MSIPDDFFKARIGNFDTTIESPDGYLIRFDREGRWGTFRNGAITYRRTIEGQVVEKIKTQYQIYTLEQEATIFQQVQKGLQKILVDIETASISLHGVRGIKENLITEINTALEWTFELYQKEKKHFSLVYPEPIPILPPDRYKNFVIQPAIGCPNSQCNFCAFYQNKTFRVLPAREFEQHIQQLIQFWGKALNSSDGIFLGSASALSLSQKKIIPILKLIREEFGTPKKGIATFLDPDHCPKRTLEDYQELKQYGLEHVTIGLETGQKKLREELGKKGDIDSIIEMIKLQNQAGIRTAITVLVGVSGSASKEEHRLETVQVIQKMNLSPSDIVYLSPVADTLPQDQLKSETTKFKDDLKKVTSAKISPYLIERFHYFA
ncbi:MAG: radical SAM superfamily enzyme YgiQ (UPF0313 family) [bacterium]|jgi:radical SAM superfamily enzyme YgiQ (UPF0313 family)